MRVKVFLIISGLTLAVLATPFAALSCIYPKDWQESVREAAKQGDVNAQFRLAVTLGLCPPDEATYWLRKAAEQGHAEAQLKLGRRYATGDGIGCDMAQALHWISMSAEQGNAEAQIWVEHKDDIAASSFKLASVEYAFGDPKAALRFRKAAELGHAEAQCKLGDCYVKGIGVSRDLNEAMRWYRRSAEQGHAEALLKQGIFYAEGIGGQKDWRAALRCFAKSAKQGNADAQYMLALAHIDGEIVEKNMNEARSWLSKSAEQGNKNAIERLFDMGVDFHEKKDFPAAASCYQVAANQGHARAQAILGDCYLSGRGVEKDERQAVYWLRKAAEQDDSHAEFLLGNCYLSGTGVEENRLEGVRWLHRAAKQGNRTAFQALELLGIPFSDFSNFDILFPSQK